MIFCFFNIHRQVLNGLRSYDPDKSSDPIQHIWTCETMQQFPCVVSDPENPRKKIRAEEAFAGSENRQGRGLIEIAASRFPLNEEYVKSLYSNAA